MSEYLLRRKSDEERVGLDVDSRGGRVMSDIHLEMRVWRKHLRESRLKVQKCENCKCQSKVKE